MIKRTDSLIHRIFEKAFKQGNLAVVDELLSSDHFAYTPSAVSEWPTGFKVADRNVPQHLSRSSGYG